MSNYKEYARHILDMNPFDTVTLRQAEIAQLKFFAADYLSQVRETETLHNALTLKQHRADIAKHAQAGLLAATGAGFLSAELAASAAVAHADALIAELNK